MSAGMGGQRESRVSITVESDGEALDFTSTVPEPRPEDVRQQVLALTEGLVAALQTTGFLERAKPEEDTPGHDWQSFRALGEGDYRKCVRCGMRYEQYEVGMECVVPVVKFHGDPGDLADADEQARQQREQKTDGVLWPTDAMRAAMDRTEASLSAAARSMVNTGLSPAGRSMVGLQPQIGAPVEESFDEEAQRPVRTHRWTKDRVCKECGDVMSDDGVNSECPGIARRLGG